MKQILQNLQTGNTEIIEVPIPFTDPGTLLINTSHTVISAGTERMLQEFGKANLLDKARQQPDKVKMVLDKIRTDGLIPTVEAVQAKLDEPITLGYCNVGTVLEVGDGVSGFKVGDRVASNGPHAEIVRVPTNLCARVPDGVADESAAFTVLGAIALQGIRLAQPTLGETVVVSGLGLVGLLTVQLLRAQGCRVLGIDYDGARVDLARSFGAEGVDLSKGEDPITAAEVFSRGRGVDAVLITAATQSSAPVSQAAKMCRKHGRIVLVGVTGLELSRADFFEKELTFQVSCAYGPGRYDPAYEEKGQDYPIGYVRWTEQRNFEAVLDMLADGSLDVQPLISHRFALDQAEQAYELLSNDEPSLGIVLEYPQATEEAPHSTLVTLKERAKERQYKAESQSVVVGFIGAGSHAGRVLMPAFRKAGAQLHTVVSSGGVSAARYGRKFGFRQAATDPVVVLEDPDINAVVIATRHDSHARFACEALATGKHVFVEKPLSLTLQELEQVQQTWLESGPEGSRPALMVGFNRRYSPHARKIREQLSARRQPAAFVMTVNAGELPSDHWTLDRTIGGGRIIGEACHFVDLLRYLAAAPITQTSVNYLGGSEDSASLQLGFANGSVGTIHYLANGQRSFPKERLEVFCGGGVLQLDNFRKLRGFGWRGFSKMNLLRQDKGHQAMAAKFYSTVIGTTPFEGICDSLEVSRVTVNLARKT